MTDTGTEANFHASSHPTDIPQDRKQVSVDQVFYFSTVNAE